MASVTTTIRIDSEAKRALDEFCREVGMSTSTAVNLFAHAVAREHRLPFEITTLPSESSYTLASRIADLEASHNIVTKTIDELDEMAR